MWARPKRRLWHNDDYDPAQWNNNKVGDWVGLLPVGRRARGRCRVFFLIQCASTTTLGARTRRKRALKNDVGFLFFLLFFFSQNSGLKTQEASDAFADGDLEREGHDMGNRSPALEDDDGNAIEPVMYTTASG